jgi:hypothetical protein
VGFQQHAVHSVEDRLCIGENLVELGQRRVIGTAARIGHDVGGCLHLLNGGDDRLGVLGVGAREGG